MRQLTYFVATTLEGRIAARDGWFDFFPADLDYLAALAAEWGIPDTLDLTISGDGIHHYQLTYRL